MTTGAMPSIAVVGSGAFATKVCHSIAAAAARPLRVDVLARDGHAAHTLAHTSILRAALHGAPVSFTGRPLGDERAVLGELRPDVVLCAASAQSPYERALRPSPWTDLVGGAGFGMTLALQSALAVRLARALAAVSQDTLLVNACFPDAVNPVIAQSGLAVHCGVGNVATLAACLQAALGLSDQQRLRVLGHHAQLSAPAEGGVEVRAWLAVEPVEQVSGLLAPGRALPRRELNAIGAVAAGRLLVAMMEGAAVATSVPGPDGLPGGYPVLVRGRELAVDPPAGLSLARAVEWNTLAGAADGVRVQDQRVRHEPGLAAALAPHLPRFADGWPVDELDQVCAALIALRERLRVA